MVCLIECKNYDRPVPVSDIEEFFAKLIFYSWRRKLAAAWIGRGSRLGNRGTQELIFCSEMKGLRSAVVRSSGDGACRNTSTVFSGFAAAKAARTGEPYCRQNCRSCCSSTGAGSIRRILRVLSHHTAANQR